MPGQLITFSGLDGAGKSTQIDLLMESLRSQGHDPVYLWARGGYTPLFNRAKDILRRLSGRRVVPSSGVTQQRQQAFARPLVRRLWLGLALLDLAILYGGQVRWWLGRGRIVICDRYIWDTLLDFNLNFPQERIAEWPAWFVVKHAAPTPELQIMILIPVAESLRRSEQKGEPFPDTPERLEQRLAAYQQLAAAGEWLVLSGRRPIEELAAAINQALPEALRAG